MIYWYVVRFVFWPVSYLCLLFEISSKTSVDLTDQLGKLGSPSCALGQPRNVPWGHRPRPGDRSHDRLTGEQITSMP